MLVYNDNKQCHFYNKYHKFHNINADNITHIRIGKRTNVPSDWRINYSNRNNCIAHHRPLLGRLTLISSIFADCFGKTAERRWLQTSSTDLLEEMRKVKNFLCAFTVDVKRNSLTIAIVSVRKYRNLKVSNKMEYSVINCNSTLKLTEL